jgi:hypothetical protein
MNITQHDRIHRAGLLTESAVNAFEQVYVVAGGSAAAILTLGQLDSDGKRWADGFAQLAGDAALFTVGIAAQRVKAAKTGRFRRFFLRVLNREFLPEQVTGSYPKASGKFWQKPGIEKAP